MKSTKKITFVIRSLPCGGTARALVDMSAGFIAAGHLVSVIILDNRENDYFKLDPKVTITRLGDWYKNEIGIKKNYSLIHSLRQSLKVSEPDFIISFVHMVNIRSILASFGLNAKLIVTEHTSPTKGHLPFIWRLVRRIIYPFADHLVSVSEGVSYEFSWMKRRSVIYNAITISPLEPCTDNERKRIGAVGRLEASKGFDMLIDAFQPLSSLFPDWDLVITGSGSEQGALLRQIKRAGLEQRVFIKAFTVNIEKEYSQMNIFVLSSRHEGMGIALAEAQACGVPCVSFDCPSGPSEIITNNIDGILVNSEDVQGMTAALKHLISNPEYREKLAKKAKISANRFKLGNIIAQWELLFDKIS